MRKWLIVLAVVWCAGVTRAQEKVVGLDTFFNHQVKDGKQWHYVWEDTKASGFSKFGEMWTKAGAKITSVEKAPTLEDLRKLSVYIICDPNTPAKAAEGKPNYIDAATADAVEAWVKEGGVVLLMANDKNNCEFEHFNTLCGRFGITFNGDLRNTVPTHTEYAHATFSKAQFPDHPLFEGVGMIYMKEISTITVKEPGKALLVVDKEKEQGEGKDVIMATSQVGKGLVFAVGDPWIYNEYVDFDRQHLPVENRKAAENLVKWLLGASSAPGGK